jgi:hypothetical protein
VEDALVADGPGSDAGEEEEGGEKWADVGAGIAEAWEENPEAADGEEDEEGGVGEGDESPEEAEEEPLRGSGGGPG